MGEFVEQIEAGSLILDEAGSGLDNLDDIDVAFQETLLQGLQQSMVVLMTRLSKFEEASRVEHIEVQMLGLSHVQQFGLMNFRPDAIQR